MDSDDKKEQANETTVDNTKVHDKSKNQDDAKKEQDQERTSKLDPSNNPPSSKPSTSIAEETVATVNVPLPSQPNLPIIVLNSASPTIRVSVNSMQPDESDESYSKDFPPLATSRFNMESADEGYVDLSSPFYSELKQLEGKIRQYLHSQSEGYDPSNSIFSEHLYCKKSKSESAETDEICSLLKTDSEATENIDVTEFSMDASVDQHSSVDFHSVGHEQSKFSSSDHSSSKKSKTESAETDEICSLLITDSAVTENIDVTEFSMDASVDQHPSVDFHSVGHEQSKFSSSDHSSSKKSKTESAERDEFYSLLKTDTEVTENIDVTELSMDTSAYQHPGDDTDEDSPGEMEMEPEVTSLIESHASQPGTSQQRNRPTSPSVIYEEHTPSHIPLNATHKQLWRLEKAALQFFSFMDDLRKNQIHRMEVQDIINRMHSSCAILYKSDNSYPILTISSSQLPQSNVIRRKLGYLITYRGKCPKMNNQSCELRCQTCNICSHMYTCNCPDSLKSNKWCCHIHAAVQGGNNVFDAEKVVFFHTTKYKMQLAHFRAMCYRIEDILPSDNNQYLVSSPGNEGNGSGNQYTVLQNVKIDFDCSKCPNYKKCLLCNLCRHQYTCNCDNFVKFRLLCEHCHAVSMYSGNRIEEDDWLRFGEYPDDSENTDEDSDDPEGADDERKIRRHKRLIAAHHERSLAIPIEHLKEIATPLSETDFMHLTKSFRIKSSTGTKFYNVKVRENTCFVDGELKCQNFCLDCRICEFRVTCDCGKPPKDICKHIHKI